MFGFLAFIIHLVIAPAIVTLIYFILIRYYPGNDYRLLFYNQNILLLGFVGIAMTISFLFYRLALKGIRIWHLIPFVSMIILLLIWSGQISLITVLATLGISVVIWLLFRKPTNVWELSFGSFLGWAVLMVVVSFMVPGGSYLFTWPLLIGLIPVGVYFLKKDHHEYSALHIGLFLLAALPVLLWFPYLTYQFLVVMELKMAGGAILFTVLCLSLLIFHIEIITRVKPWLIPILSFSAGLFFLLYGSVNLQYNERFKKQNSLILATNGNTGETFFTSFNDKIDEWTVDYLSAYPDTSKLSDFFPNAKSDFLKKTIEMENLTTPSLIVMNDSIINSQRFVKLHLNSGRNADKLFIYINSYSDSLKVAINKSGMKELKLPEGTEWYYIRYFAFPEEGIDMEIQLTEKQNLEICLTNRIYGLPVLKGIEIKPRPDYMMSNGDMTLATKKFVITHGKSN